MASKVTLINLSKVDSTITNDLNTNFTRLADAIDDALDRTGASPNHLEDDVDANDFQIKNLGKPTLDNHALRLADIPDDAKTAKATAVSLEDTGGNFSSDNVEGALEEIDNVKIVDSVSDLQSGSFESGVERIWLSGYYGVGTAGGGPLYRDSGDTTTADNGGTVFVDSDGVRWKRPHDYVLHVDWFGARPDDGNTDDQPAVQSAINSSTHGAVIQFGAGTYFFSKEVSYRSGITVRGRGIGATVIEMTAHGDAFRSPSPNKGDPKVEDVHFSDMTIDGRKDSLGVSSTIYTDDVRTAGIRLINVSRGTVQRVFGRRHSAYAIESKLSQSIVIDSCFATDNSDDGISISDINKGDAAPEGQDIVVSNCVSWANTIEPGQRTGSGFEVDDGPVNVQFVNCVAYNNQGVGFDIHTHSGAKGPQYVQYTNCISYSNDKHGFFLEGASNPADFTEVPKYITYSNCQSYDNGSDGWYIANAVRFAVDNCRSQFNGEHGYHFGSVSGDFPSESMVKGCLGWGNSRNTDLGFSNFRVIGAPQVISFNACVAKAGEAANQPEYGANIGSGGHRLSNNDWKDGGATGDLNLVVDGFSDHYVDNTDGATSGGETVYYASGVKEVWRTITLSFDTSTRLKATWTFDNTPDSNFMGDPAISVTPVFLTLSSTNLTHENVGQVFYNITGAAEADIVIYRDTGAPDFTSGDTIDVQVRAVGTYRDTASVS